MIYSDSTDKTDVGIEMAGRSSGPKIKGKVKVMPKNTSLPNVYEEMLAEALPLQIEPPGRPLKRRKVGGRRDAKPINSPAKSPSHDNNEDEEDEENFAFEDVLGDLIDGTIPPAKQRQTAYRDSEEDSESDFDWEGFELDEGQEAKGASGDLDLTLKKRVSPPRKLVNRRKAVTKTEKAERLHVHKMHILCLLSYLNRRNHWCEDTEVQKILKRLLDKKTLLYLRPKSSLSQFGQAESLKRGLDELSLMWRNMFNVTARGMRKPLWAESEVQLHDYQLPDDIDTCFGKSEFLEAAKKLKGSRDLGVQLYCALLRSAGVETRLVCSLQVLSFNAGGPSMPQLSQQIYKPTSVGHSASLNHHNDNDQLVSSESHQSITEAIIPAPRSRLGHPSAADYYMPEVSSLPKPVHRSKPKVIHESPFPVFWVEVLDEAHQKWFPVDPLVTQSIAKPRVFEPPSSDRENSMCYVIAFDEDGYARDVTKRYAKAYNAKTRKTRVESTIGGDKWWRRAMRMYHRGYRTDADQLEDSELAVLEGREPMPKNIQDFKDHPIYALERHLRRNEVLTSSHAVGRVAAGRDLSVPGGKRMENVFRRRDVKVAKSADAWYRQGKDIRMGQQPVKIVEAKRRADEADDDAEERPGTNLYTEDQTEPYEAPPVVNGRVPKNSFGNLDLYVPSMLPRGGVHLPYAEASRAARLLNIDYSDALVGFEFRGRHGTAVLKGVVVAAEYREAVEAIVEGLRDEQAQAEQDIRTLASLRLWKKFMIALRIKERIDGYAIEGEEKEIEGDSDVYQEDDGAGMETDEYDEEEGGGFITE